MTESKAQAPARKTWRRAIADSEKATRQADILKAALRLFGESRGALPSVSEIAEASGLAKGTVYLYFRTKEEIFLALLAEQYASWIGAIGAGLSRSAKEASRERKLGVIISGIVVFCLENPTFLKLACMSQSVLEQNLSLPAARKFKEKLALDVAGLGDRMAQSFPGLKRDRAVETLLRTYALIIGLWQICEVPPAMASLRKRPELAHLFPEFEKQLAASVRALLSGSIAGP